MAGEKRKLSKSTASSSASKRSKIISDFVNEENDGDISDDESSTDEENIVTVKILSIAEILCPVCDILNFPIEAKVSATGLISLTPDETGATLKTKIMDLIHEYYPFHTGGFEYINFYPDVGQWLFWFKERKTGRLPSAAFDIDVIFIRLTPKDDKSKFEENFNTGNDHLLDDDSREESREIISTRNCIKWRTNNEDPMEILMELIKKNFRRFVGINQLKEVAKKIAEDAYFNWLENLPRHHPGHIVIVGNPGVGKTTGAIALANFLNEASLVLSDNIIEAHRDDLVDKYVGGTEMKTNDVIHSARGGVIIFDEIYTLHKPSSPNDTGKEALTTIMKYMTDDCSPVFMFLGYKDHMREFVNMNPGFQRRIKYTIELKDYSCEDLSQIVHMKLRERTEIQLEDGFRLESYFRELPPSYLKLHNASVAIKLIDYALDSARQRVLALHYMDRRGATVLKADDFEAAFQKIKQQSEDAGDHSPPTSEMYM